MPSNPVRGAVDSLANSRGRSMQHILVGLGLTAVEVRLMPARIDHKQHVALFHELSRLKADFLDVTGDARPHFDGFDRFRPSGEFVPFDDLALLDRRNGHGRHRRPQLRGLTSAAGEEKDRRAKRQRWHGKADEKSE